MLSLEGVSVRFGGLTAVKGVTLAMPADEIMGLVGPNGAGKTTLFNAISGFVRVAAGRIRFEGADVLGLAQHRRARLGLARTFQIPQPLQHLTVRENLVVAQRFGAGTVDERRIDEILALVGLEPHAQRAAALELSLTELKALEVARALAIRPRLLLLDEMLAGLESGAKRAFAGLLGRIHDEWRVGLLVIEHDIETIRSLCPRVAVLDFGELIADGTPEAVFRDPRVVGSYTGEPHA